MMTKEDFKAKNYNGLSRCHIWTIIQGIVPMWGLFP